MRGALLVLIILLACPGLGGAGDICPHLNVQPCANIGTTRPRTCTACIGVTIDQPSVAYLYQGQKKEVKCILHGLFSNNPTAKWVGEDSKGIGTEITKDVTETTDTVQGTKTTTLTLTVGDEDMKYSCKYTAPDGFSVEDYIVHQNAVAESTKRCEVSSDGDYFNKFWGYTDKTNIISSSDAGYAVSFADPMMSLVLDQSSTWEQKLTYRCSASFVAATGAFKSISVKAAHIVESAMSAVVWAGEASTITLMLASVNPLAESVRMNFGTNVIAGQLKGDLYTATGELTLDSTAEKIWTISSEFKYPDENAVTINEHYQLYVATLETPKKYVCFKGEDCDITITFSLSTIDGITSNGQICDFRTNNADKKTVSWKYENKKITATTKLENVADKDSENTYKWTFHLQNNTQHSMDITLDVAEIVAKDLTVFDAFTQTVTYQFEIQGADVAPTACYTLMAKEGEEDEKRTGTLDGNVCTVKGAQVEAQSEYSYTCVFEINGQTLKQKVSTDFIVLEASPSKPVVNVTGADVTMVCTAKDYQKEPVEVTWDCTGEWCEHASKNLKEKLTEVGYDDLHKAQDACAANQECTGVTKEVRNGVTKYYLMKGELTASEEDDTSWVSGTCAEDHSGWISIIADCYQSACAKPFDLEKHSLQVRYTAQDDQEKYVNFFDEKKERIGFIKWSLNPGTVQIYDCSDAEELSWTKTPPTSTDSRTWTISRSKSHITLKLGEEEMFSYEFKDEPKCKALYEKDIKYVSFNEFLSKTTSPQYLNVGSENQDVPKTVKEATTAVSSYTNSNLTRDTTCTCTFKFNDISILSKTFKIYEAKRLTPNAYYSLQKTEVEPACSFSVEYADLEGTVQWFFKDEVIKNEKFTMTKFDETEIYNISSSLGLTALQEESSALVTCKFLFTNEPSITWTVAVGKVEFPVNELVFSALTKTLSYDCSIIGSDEDTKWTYYRSFSGGEEKKLDAPAWTEDSWGLTDYTLKCRAELPSQNLTTQYVVDRTETVTTPTIKEGEQYIQVWMHEMSEISVQLTQLIHQPVGASYVCKDAEDNDFPPKDGKDDTSTAWELLVPISKMHRRGIWDDVTCTYTFKFKDSDVSVPFKVDVYGMSNVTKVTTAGSPLEVVLSTYGLKDVTNVEISWDIGGSVANKAEGYTSTVTKNETGVTSTLKVAAIPVEKHGSHKITVSTNGGDASSTLQLFVIDINRTPHPSVLQQKGTVVNLVCDCINWKDNATISWDQEGTIANKFSLSSIQSTYTANFAEDTKVACKFAFHDSVDISKDFDVDVFEMGDVSREAIADVKSTLKVEFPITGLKDFNAATKTWSFNEKKHTIPATYWKDMTECADVQCTTVFHFQYISLDIKLNYETAAAKKIHFYSEDLQLMGTLSWTDYKDLILTGYNNALAWTKDPGYTSETSTLEWHIDISDHKLVIMSPDEQTKYLDLDLKVGGECTTNMCSKTVTRVAFQGFTGLSAKVYDFLVEDRHYIEQTGTTGNSGGVYTLTVADVEGKDRGTIPISITGPDKQEHVANIKIYIIEFEGGDKKSYTHQKGESLKLTAKISGWLTKPTKVDWYTDTSPITDTIETTHGDSESQSILTHGFTEDKVVYCKYTIGDLTAIKTFYLDVFELVDQTALALVGDDVKFDFTLPGVANEATVDITWKWNGLSGNVNEQGANSVSEWKDVTCGCSSASCACPDDMNIVTYDVHVQQPTTVVARSDNWRTVVFYTEKDTWITYISWNDQKSKVKTKCKNTEHDVVLPAAKDNIREYKIDINSTHLTLYCQDKIIASDPADCNDDFVPNEWMSIAKVGFNTDLKDDGAKKMIKKDDRVHVKKTSYNADTDTFSLQLNIQDVRPDDTGDVEMSVKDKQDDGLTYTSHVKVIYSSLTFEDVRIVSESETVPDASLQCSTKLNSRQTFKISIMCDKDGSLPIATYTATDSTGHTLDHVLNNLTPESCLQFKCLLEVGSQSVSDTNDVGILYHVSSEKWLVNEGWNGKLTTSANYIGMDSHLQKSCTWKTSDKNYASTFEMDKDKLSCTVDFSSVTVTDTAVIDVTGFGIGGGKHAVTQAKLHVGTVTTSVEIGINEIATPTVYCNVSGLDQTASVAFNVPGAKLSTSIGDTGRSDKWEISGTYQDDEYPVCTYTMAGYQGKLDGTVKLYVIDADLVSVAGLGAGSVGRITCNLHHEVLDIIDQSFSWMVNNEKVEGGNTQMKIISDYEGAKHNDHWYNSSSTLILLDVDKQTYKFHCFMSFHKDEELSYSESMDPIWITPDHKDYDSAVDAVIKYNIPQKCDSNFVIDQNVYKLFNEFHNISTYHLQNVKITESYVDKKTFITTTMSDISTTNTGHYYHLCGVDYTITKAGTESKVTEYLFLPFHINVIDLVTIGTYPQSKGHPTDLFFQVTHLDDHVKTVTVSYGTEKTVESVSLYTMEEEKKIDGPYKSVITIKKTEKEMLVYVTLLAGQTVGAVVTCEFLIGSDIFSREAKLGDFYEYATKDKTYTMGEKVSVSLSLMEIPTNKATFSMESPFNARGETFTLTSSYEATEKKTSLGEPIFNCVLKIDHDKASLALAGYYVVNVTVPENSMYHQFQIDTRVGISIVDTERVDITMISESGTTATVELNDYSELDLIKVTGLTWKPSLPASITVSDVTKNGRSHEATVTIKAVPVAAAGTYQFSFTLETGETYSADLVLSVIEKTVNTSSKEVCAAETYTNQIYGTLHFPDTKSGDTATVACFYNSMTVTADVATRKCSNGTWQSVNQTLCGSQETAELQKIFMAATASSEDKEEDTFKSQIEYMTQLKEFTKTSVSKLSGSDLEGVNTIISTVSKDSVFYEESAALIVDILDTVIEGAADEAVSIYSLSELSLRKTAVDLGKTVLKNNTATTKTFKGTKMTLLTTPAESSDNTTIETTVSDKTLTISLPDKSGLFSSSALSPGYIVAAYSVAADIFQTENTASSVISPAVEIELSDHSQDTSNLTNPLMIFFELNEKIPDPNGIAAVYYDTKTSTWSTAGCKTNITSNTTVTAICYHLSAFAIQYTDVEYVDEVSIHQTKFAGAGVSLIFLGMAITLLLVHRVPRQDQIVITHVFLVGTMVAANLFLTIAVNVKDSALGPGCPILAFLVNLTWIAVHMWVLVEGILLNQIVNEGYSYRVDKQFIRFAGFSFGTATLVALVGAIVMSVTSTYVNQAQDICWLDGPALLYFMWLPILVLSLVSFALLLKCAIFLKKNQHKHFPEEVVIVKKTILAVLVLLILLDVGWVFAGVAGANTLDPSMTEIQTFCNVLYIVFNVLQGVAVVVMFCILNPKVMEAWRNMKNPPPDAEQGPEEEKIEGELEVPVEVEVPAQQVVDDTDVRSRRSHKSGYSMKSGRSARSAPRTVGDTMSAAAAASPVQPVIVEDEEKAVTETPKKKKKKKNEGAEDDGAERINEGETKSKKSRKKTVVTEGNEEEAPKKKKKKKTAEEDGGETKRTDQEDGTGEPSVKPKKKKKKPEVENKEEET